MESAVLQQVRVFNRFFTAKLNIFNRYVLGTSYSLVEGRVIGEIGRNEGCTASDIAECLHMDKSYLSRILAKFEASGFIIRSVSGKDNRKKQLSLTKSGYELFEKFEYLSDQQVEELLSGLDHKEIEELLKSMQGIHKLLNRNEG